MVAVREVEAQQDQCLIEWMLALIEENVSKYYAKCSWGWNQASKRQELSLPNMRYLFGYGDETEAPVGYCSFMKTHELDMQGKKRLVMYCYELHVQEAYRGRGLGKQLLSALEAIAKEHQGRPLVMLTCFTANAMAINFYKGNGYRIDEISPDPEVSDYIIMSKKIIN